jgi:hypothetical protein
LAEAALAKSTTAAVKVVHFILRSPDLFRVQRVDFAFHPSWVADAGRREVCRSHYVWVHLM